MTSDNESRREIDWMRTSEFGPTRFKPSQTANSGDTGRRVESGAAMTEYNVGDRVLVPGEVKYVQPQTGWCTVAHPDGVNTFDSVNLRPDTGGRDLTASIVITLMQGWRTGRRSVDQVTEELNRVARGDRPSGAGDTAPPAEPDGTPYVVAMQMDDGSASGLWSMDSYATAGEAAEVAAVAGPSRAVYELVPAPAAGPRAGDTDEARALRGEELDGDAPDLPDHEAIGKVRREAARAVERSEFGAYIKTPVLIHVADLAERAVADPRAGDTASDDEVMATLKSAYDHACADWRQRADVLVAERDAARSEAAELRAAGNALADTAIAWNRDNPLRWVNVKKRVAAWRSAAGTPATEGDG